jgi:hypothetical protein
MMKVTINVIDEDIREGLARDCWDCPISRATNRELPQFKAAVFDDALILIPLDGGMNLTFDLPLEAQKFIAEFDDGDEPEPFSFELEFDDE